MLVRQNNRKDVRPRAIFTAVSPTKLHGFLIMMVLMSRAMCLTVEEVISDFRLVCRRQMELVIIFPHGDNRIKG